MAGERASPCAKTLECGKKLSKKLIHVHVNICTVVRDTNNGLHFHVQTDDVGNVYASGKGTA